MFYCISFTVAVFEFPHMLRILGLPSRARTPCSWCAVFGHFFYPRRATAHEGRGGMGDDCNCLRYTYSYILYALYMIHDNGFYYINCKCFGVSEFITFHVYLVLIRRINSRARARCDRYQILLNPLTCMCMTCGLISHRVRASVEWIFASWLRVRSSAKPVRSKEKWICI
jgi:hypothetical protein